ncbi:MAG: hypothetical protein J6N15_07725 [Ruminiclostridium sp.]|nr:hypothetical protein [Ruminiclostridium sp.]
MNISFRQYRAIDLTIMLVILAAAEAVIVTAAKFWFPGELYVLSPTITIVCIVMMRWGGFAAIHAVAGGLAMCIASGASTEQYVIYCVGNCAALIALLWFRFLGKEKVRSKVLFTALFTLTAFCAEQVGRWLVALIFGGTAGNIFGFFASDSLSLIFAILVVQLTRRLDGVFEDQKTYLLRIQAEQKRREAEAEYGEDPGNY